MAVQHYTDCCNQSERIQDCVHGKVKQELTVADTTECTILTLWEENIDSLEEGKSYQLNRFQVHTYFVP